MTPTNAREQLVDFGPLPEDWTLEPLRKYLTRRRSVVGSNSRVHTLLSLTLRGVIVRDLSQMKGKFPASFDSYQEVKTGDLVFCLFDVEETPRTVGCARVGGMITGAYDVFVCNDPLVREFLLRLLTVQDDQKRFAPLYRGLRKTIPKGSLLALRVPIPPRSDLPLIVRYLDHAEMRIARAIAGKRRVSALLAEHLAAIKEVCLLYGGTFETLGLVEGLENLGAISLATRPQPAGLMFREVRRKPNPGIPKLSLSMSRGLVRSRTVSQKGSELSSSLTYSMARRGDIVMNKYRAYLGAFAPCTEDGLITPNYTVLEPVMNLSAEFYALLFSTHAFQGLWRMKSKGVGDGMMPLYTNEFRRTRVPWYPLEVQQYRLDAYLGASESTRKALDAVELEIALLKEYRTRLISDVVTGKLDVRKEAASLPDVDPNELAAVLAGGATSTDEEEGADGDE